MAFKTKIVSPENARARLENLCARSEHCECELREKLRQWNVSASDADSILSALRDLRFYDDRRFAEAYVHDKMVYNGWGRRKIALALMAKRIPREFVSEVLAEIDNEEYLNLLKDLMRAKASRITEGNTFEGRTKLIRSLSSRGFEVSLITKLMHNELIWPEQLGNSGEVQN